MTTVTARCVTCGWAADYPDTAAAFRSMERHYESRPTCREPLMPATAPRVLERDPRLEERSWKDVRKAAS